MHAGDRGRRLDDIEFDPCDDDRPVDAGGDGKREFQLPGRGTVLRLGVIDEGLRLTRLDVHIREVEVLEATRNENAELTRGLDFDDTHSRVDKQCFTCGGFHCGVTCKANNPRDDSSYGEAASCNDECKYCCAPIASSMPRHSSPSRSSSRD